MMSQQIDPLQQRANALMIGLEYNPHQLLGFHPEERIIRLWRPGAEKVYIEIKGEVVETRRVHDAGLFDYSIDQQMSPLDYRVYSQQGVLTHDPYAFLPSVSDVDLYLFSKGTHYQIYNVMGARLCEHQGVRGVRFCVWAPAAKAVSVVGDFNHWDGRLHPMRSLGSSGVWELFIPGIEEGNRYKFEIRRQNHELNVKADPYSLQGEIRPFNSSVITDVDKFEWQDSEWMKRRFENQGKPYPMNVYEVHLGSWRKNDGQFCNYKELAKLLTDYCKEMGFTHVELLPIQEHPLDESWGYQVSGFYAVTSRFGTPQDFQWFVNYLHSHEIGVILDWVPGHFPSDAFSLSHFDGTALYEHEDPRQGWHPHWNTYIFNYSRHEVSNFLIANALFWFDKMHVDGLRVDAVASMLYLDYGRTEGGWIPNCFGGNENLDAIEFIKHLNSVVHDRFPGVLMIAEESTSFAKMTTPVQDGGLGFDLKWNMGWMNDTLRYFEKDPLYRFYHQNNLTFGLVYAFSEKFILVLSHDEVVHGKQSLISKMPGDVWQKFANLRLLYSYMVCHPGKNLLFMGGEVGQWNEWRCKGEIEWFLLQFPSHHSIQTLVKDINHFYLNHSPLWEKDFEPEGFEWVDFADNTNSVIAYLRKGSQGCLLCVHHFTPNYLGDYILNLRNVTYIEEVFNSDAEKYGGSGKLNSQVPILKEQNGQPYAIKIQLAPLATMIFNVSFQ